MRKNTGLICVTVFIAALLPRLFFSVTASETPSHDAFGYDHRAVSLISGTGYAESGRPTAFKEPFYSFFLAGIYSLFGHSYLAVRVIQAVLGALICVFVFLIAEGSFGRKVAVLAAGLSAINPGLIKAPQHLLTETLFTFILVVIMFCCLKLLRKPDKLTAAALGILWGLGSLTRSVLLPFGALVCVLVYVFLRGKSPKREAILIAAVMFTCFSLTVLPWTLRNWKVFHRFIPISTNVGINLYSSYFPPQGKLFGFTASDEVTKAADNLPTEPEKSEYLLKKTFARIRVVKIGYILKVELLKALYFWCPFDWEIVGKGAYNYIYAFVLPFFLFGIYWASAKGKGSLLILLPVVYLFVFSLITYGSPRFRLPAEPFITILACLGITHLLARNLKRPVTFSLIASFFAFNLILYFNSFQAKLFFKGILTRSGIW